MKPDRNEELMCALADKMAELLRQEEDWHATARWLDSRARDDGFDLSLRYDNPELWSRDLVENLRLHVSFASQWPDGLQKPLTAMLRNYSAA